jgi:hypothetical protein
MRWKRAICPPTFCISAARSWSSGTTFAFPVLTWLKMRSPTTARNGLKRLDVCSPSGGPHKGSVARLTDNELLGLEEAQSLKDSCANLLWRLASLHRLVLLFRVAVLRDRRDRGIEHLAAACGGLWIQGSNRNAQTTSRSVQLWRASRGTATGSCRRDRRPRTRAPKPSER